MRDLIEQLEKLTGPNYAMDQGIADIIGLTHGLRIPPYTASIDAALTLVPAGNISWQVADSPGGPTATLFDGESEITGYPSAGCSTPAIALCIAACKARNL